VTLSLTRPAGIALDASIKIILPRPLSLLILEILNDILYLIKADHVFTKAIALPGLTESVSCSPYLTPIVTRVALYTPTGVRALSWRKSEFVTTPLDSNPITPRQKLHQLEDG
jgi:hypothetical protein